MPSRAVHADRALRRLHLSLRHDSDAGASGWLGPHRITSLSEDVPFDGSAFWRGRVKVTLGGKALRGNAELCAQRRDVDGEYGVVLAELSAE